MDAKITQYAQRIYLTLKGRRYDDLTSDEGKEYLLNVYDFTNMFLDELESVVNNDGQPISWWFTRENGHELGSAAVGESSIDVPSEVDRIITEEQRYVQITQDGTVVSNWVVVNPKNISSQTDRITENMCAVVGTSLVFSRAFKDYEDGGTVIGDVTLKLPRMSATNIKVLDIVRPQTLLVLGCAKNIILPDIVQGDLAPSYQSKYKELLDGAVARSNASGGAQHATAESLAYIGGI